MYGLYKALRLVIHRCFVLAEAFSVLLSGNAENIVSAVPWERNKTFQPGGGEALCFLLCCCSLFTLLGPSPTRSLTTLILRLSAAPLKVNQDK